MKTILHSSLVLKLNGCWQAMEYLTVRDAFHRMFKTDGDAIRALEVVLDDDGSISNQSESFTGTEWLKQPVRETDIWVGLPHNKRVRVPLVVITPHFHLLPKVMLQFNKRGLYTRDRGICSYCDRLLTYDEATNDHVIPVYQGGETSWENCTLSCGPCNTLKGARTPEEAGMRLRRKPKVPGLMPKRPELRHNAPAVHLALLAA